MKTLLIVDDEVKICVLLSRFFESRGLRTLTANSGSEALEKLDSNHPDYLLLDIRMPDMSGLDVLRVAKQRQPQLNVVMLTALNDAELAKTAFGLGASDYLTKPFGWGDQELARVFFTPSN